MRTILGLSLMSLAACASDKEDGDSGAGGDGGSTGMDRFDEFINVTVTSTGDQTCFDGLTWNTQTVDPLKAGHEISADYEVLDFESDDPVSDATIEIWFDNLITGTADSTAVTGADGTVGGPYPVCQAVAYKVWTDPDLDETKVTFEVNQVGVYTESSMTVEFNSVSSTTYAIIPSLLGVSPDADKGIAAGTVYDCDGEPIMGAQVLVRGTDQSIPESLVVKYFVDEFPNRGQEYTSEDGLWVAINIPAGDAIAEAYVADGLGGYTLIGKANMSVQADSINIASIYTGIEDGVYYPENCLEGF